MGTPDEEGLVRVVAVDPDLLTMMRQVLAEPRATMSEPDPGMLDLRLWQRLSDVGLTRLTGSEEGGGSGATWVEAGALLGLVAGAAGAVPLAEHDLLAGWVLDRARLETPLGPTSAAVLDAEGMARDVPWAAQVERLVVVRDAGGHSEVALVPTAALDVEDGRNLAGSPRGTVRVGSAAISWTSVEADLSRELHLRGALARAAQLCGAMDRIVDLCVEHATVRVQFGRPLATFQAVQELVSNAAAEAALARAATDAALAAVAKGDFGEDAAEFAIAVARSCAGHAATTVVRNAHQVHGAIGTTREHQLHELTRPVLAWRSECGSMRHWDDYLTKVAVRAGRGVWSVVAEGAPTNL